MTKTAIIYARVSSKKQGERELSLEAQIKVCRRFAESQGYEVVKVFQEVESAYGSAEKREVFQEAIEFARKSKIDAFIVYDTSRFARDRKDAIVYKHILRRSGVQVLYATQNIDTTDELTGMFIEGILELVDEYYSRILAKHTLKSMIENAKQGYWNNGTPPFGYRAKVVRTVANRRKVKLEVEPSEAVIVRRIFEEYISGVGAKEIAKRLNAEGKLNRGKPWTNNAILRILKNEIYYGCYIFNRRNSRTGKLKPREEWVVVENFCEPIVSKHLWNKANERLSSVDRPARHRSKLLLAGLLRCGHCGAPMVSDKGRGRSGRIYTYYQCQTYKKSGECQNMRTQADIVDRKFINAFLEEVLTEDRLRKIYERLYEELNRSKEPLKKKLSLLRQEYAQIETAIENLYKALERGIIDDEILSYRLRQHIRRKGEIEQEIEEIELKLAQKPKLIPTNELNIIKDVIRQKVERGEVKALREDLKRLIQRVELTKHGKSLNLKVFFGVHILETHGTPGGI